MTSTPEKISDVLDEHSSAERGTGAVDSYSSNRDAERRLRTKIDWAIVPIVSFLYLFCFIDRANIGNARLAGLEQDLGMTGYDYNTLLSIFYISYILFEIPSTIACKWIGPGRFIPFLTLAFGVVSVGTAFVHTLSEACGVRFVLGIFEAGMMPCISYYLSRWYRRGELAFRLSLFIVMAPLAGAFGGLLASGILSLDHFGTLRSWRMIFAIEGIITIGLAIIAFFTLTDRPETARWLNEEEKALAVSRVQSERVAQSKVLDKMGKQKLWLGFWNPMILATAFTFLLNNITVQGLAFFTPTIVGTIYPTFSTVQKQLYTVPPFVVGAFFELLLPLMAWRLDKRQIFIVASTPMVMAGYIMFLATNNPTARYAATFLTASSCFAVGTLTNAQAAAMVSSDTSRSMSLAINMMGGNIGGLIATWTYLPWDKPDFKIGNGINLGASGLILLVSTAALLWMHRDNKKRDGRDAEEQLRGLSEAEIESLEWKHPNWRWYP
ncbi:major facilitator superfamily domain-containing protein [Microdochium trichocladiopsis]|uniref:Major facilitator superfamily domain-containing protein n=1 Tax=Microdochium trichocladiopsis TaxID=1682393 RepID=A0A9P9BUE0_9PEZI|nr:major facilitator superfamily domain-containing protein [Microdochium trichocladiopsis]KAH7040886.1 major facilitator superfamily domain-containing protein [Microdochium trichocladiopsis]